MKPRKHAELIKAWADGATIERLWNDYNGRVSSWLIDNEPDWSEFEEYRIKSEPKPNWYRHYMVAKEGDGIYPRGTCETMNANLRLYFDGNTGMLINAELIGK